MGSQRVWPQVFLAILCNMGTLTFGLTIGWLAPLQPRFTTEGASPLGPAAAPLSLGELSWLAAMPALSLLVCTPAFGLIMQRTGPKVSALVSNAPILLAYGLQLYSSNVYTLYVARFIAGFGAAGSLINAPVYVNECSRDDIRGVLGGLSGLFINIGVIAVFTLGGYTSYTVLNVGCMMFTVVFLVFYPWLPDSPLYLLRRGKAREATDALLKLRGGTREEMEAEAARLSKGLGEGAPRVTVAGALRDPATRRGVLVITGVYSVQQCSGISAILSFTVHILETAGSSVSPYLAATVLAVVQLLGSTTGAALADRAGRRALLLFSATVMSVSLLTFSLYLGTRHLHEVELLRWVPPLALMFYIYAYALGFGTIPFVLLPELFSPHMRGVAVSIVGTWVSLLAFAVSLLFPLLSEALTLTGCFAIFTAASVLGCFFVHGMVFETNGRTTAEILQMLGGRTSGETAGGEALEMKVDGVTV